MVALFLLLCVKLQVERRKKSQIEVKSGRGAIAHGE
jgi:hypothetical protein